MVRGVGEVEVPGRLRIKVEIEAVAQVTGNELTAALALCLRGAAAELRNAERETSANVPGKDDLP